MHPGSFFLGEVLNKASDGERWSGKLFLYEGEAEVNDLSLTWCFWLGFFFKDVYSISNH